MNAQSGKDMSINANQKVREWLHSASNALFIARGFLEELECEVHESNNATIDSQNVLKTLQAVLRNVDKIDSSLQNLRQFAKQEL